MPKASTKVKANRKPNAGGMRISGNLPSQKVTKSPAPVAMGYTVSKQDGARPRMRVAHTELVCQLTNDGTTTFVVPAAIQSFPGVTDLNPANVYAFPWLASIASCFEKWRVHKLVYRLIPCNPTSVAGAAYVAFDYDFADPVPSTAAELMQNRSAAQTTVWEAIVLPVSVKDVHLDMPWRYCSTNSSRSADFEPRNSYGGFLNVGIQSSSSLLWNLYVDYDFEFADPCSEKLGLDMLSFTGQTPVASPSPINLDVGGLVKAVLAPAVEGVLGKTGIKAVYGTQKGTPGLTWPQATPKGISTTFTDLAALNGFDFRACRDGAINIIADYLAPGNSPATVVSSYHPSIAARFFDAQGLFLGDIKQDASVASLLGETGAIGSTGAAYPCSAGDGTSDYVRSLLTLCPDKIRAKWPTAAYFTTALVYAAGLVITSLRFGMQVSRIK